MNHLPLLLATLLLSFASAAAQVNTSNNLAQELKEEYGAQVLLHSSTGQAQFIQFHRDNRMELSGDDLLSKAWQFLHNYSELWSIDDPENVFDYLGTQIDLAGHHHLRFRQHHRGIAVFDGELRFHFDDTSRLSTVSGLVIPCNNLPTLAQIDTNAALQAAKGILNKAHKRVYTGLVPPRLLIYRQGLAQGIPGESYLVYELLLGDGLTDRQYVYLDAQSGRLIDKLPANCSALYREVYSGNTTGSPVWEESDGNIDDLTGERESIAKVSGHTYYLFSHAFNFDSYDDSGANMKGVVDATNVNCPNATWNGTSANFCTGYGVDDVVAHEWGHAYTQYTNNLIYAWQAGAINEAYSDIWGETVDLLNGFGDDTGHNTLRTACNSSIRWQMGEELGSAIRDMWLPSCKGDPDAVTSNNYYCSSGDSGGVHINSGIPNHAYALLVDGGTFNGETVTPLGFTKAAHIFWQAQSQYLNRTSNFSLLAAALQAACTDLLGVDLPALGLTSVDPGLSGEIITAADCNEVDDAIAAVAMTASPNCSFSPLFDANTPDICALNDFQTFYSTDFESGATGWTMTEVPSNPGSWNSRNWELDASLPDGRSGQSMYGPDPVFGDCSSDLDNGIIELASPAISIPGTFTAPLYLSFDHYVSMELNWDGGIVQYQIDGGSWTDVSSGDFTFNPYNISLRTVGQGNDNPLAGKDSFTGADEGSVSCTWGTSHINIGNQAGKTVRFRWQLGVDGCNGWDGWYIDDVLVGGCTSAILPVGWQSFTVLSKAKTALLNWTTAREENNAGFWVERSKDPKLGFKTLSWVSGSGTINETQSYTYQDAEVEAGITYYYRLRQVDFAGSEELSPIRLFRLSAKTLPSLQVFPNPAGSVAYLRWLGTASSQWSVNIYHLDGRRAADTAVYHQLTTGQQIQLDIARLSAGLYWVVVETVEGVLARERLIVE